jgi:hypothetical protein
MELRVLRFRGDQDGDVRVGIFPEHEEVLISRLSFWAVSPCMARVRARRDLAGGTRKCELLQRNAMEIPVRRLKRVDVERRTESRIHDMWNHHR